jgi:hypothetical protein
MPPRVFATLLLTVIGAAGLTIAAVTAAGLPLAALGLVALLAAGALRFWGRR